MTLPKNQVTLTDLLNMPFNMVHELHRLAFLKTQAEKERQEQEEKEKQEKAKKQQQEHREQVAQNVPVFAQKYENFDPAKQTPPQKPLAPAQAAKAINERQKASGQDPATQALVKNMTAVGAEELLEEVIGN